MKNPGFQPAEPRPREESRERRVRHFPRSARLLVVALLLLLSFVAFVSFVVGAVGMVMTRLPEWGWLALGGLGVMVVTRGVVFIIGDSRTCPL